VPIEVKMAKLSPTMETGQMVKWYVKVGDKVKEGDTLAEIQTDKAVMPMESFDEGTVARLDVKEGDDIALGQTILVLAKKGEDAAAIGKASASSKPATATAPASDTNGSPAPSVAVPEPEAVSTGHVRSTPLARKVAAAAGVDIGKVSGSGPSGRVIRADIESFLESKPAASPKSAFTRPATASRESIRIPHTQMRKTIADRMLKSKQAAPEIHVTVDIRVDKIAAIRESLNKALAAEKIKLSMGDFVTKAVALALRKHPGVNASYEADAIVQHGDVNVGIAVAMEGGLMVPVLHKTDTLGLKEIRLGTEELAVATRGGKLKPQQMMGGTFTISNLGMYGVRQFDAILNLPEVAILAVGAAEKRAVVAGDSLVVGQMMTVTLTADHRAVDGALAAEFLRTFKGFLEEPAMMLL
jgi:pyruvate dehydrogenase E2 component (dihydrolipoamide acetyltransferase)